LVLLQGDKLLFLTENFKAKQGNFVRAGSWKNNLKLYS
jgi:hypothetical protein